MLARSLVGRDPSPYVLERYAEFHERFGARETARMRRFDHALVAIARTHPLLTRVCDAYAVRFRRGTALRRKLVLLLALLECAPTTFELIDRPGRGGVALAYPRLVARAVLEGLLLVVGLLTLFPLQLALSLAPATGSGETP